MRHRTFTPKQEETRSAIWAEIDKLKKRHAEIRTEQEAMFKRERELFLQLAFIGRGPI